MKLKIKGHYVTIFNSRDEQHPVGLNLDGVFLGKTDNFDLAATMAEKAIDKIEKLQTPK